MHSDSPVVSVIVLTYNQENYIRQCIESVLSQETEYPFEVILGEDMGTDSTREICKQYAAEDDRIILPDREKNLGVTMNWVRCVQQARGKYVMSIGGDDFWHNFEKIQMQVEFMEKHPECVICHTDKNILYTRTNKLIRDFNRCKGINPPEGRIQKEVVAGREHIAAGTMCIRRDMIVRHLPFELFEREQFPCEDWPTIVILSAYGDVRYIPVSTITYRIGQESVLNQRDYDKIRRYWKQSGNMTRVMHELFPKELGPYEDEPYFTQYVNHSLLKAAYVNNDYESAQGFARLDPSKGLAPKMARSKMTFQLFRGWELFKSFFNY